MFWETIAGSFALVAAGEMGDKTQLLAFSLAGRFRRPWTVMAGILVATLANHALASSLGAWLSEHVPARVMAGSVTAAFLAFGIWALRPDQAEACDKPSRGLVAPTGRGLAPHPSPLPARYAHGARGPEGLAPGRGDRKAERPLSGRGKRN
jgi:putative Ca2+/H+ antiporter (TMEM165/GDT1 family)